MDYAKFPFSWLAYGGVHVDVVELAVEGCSKVAAAAGGSDGGCLLVLGEFVGPHSLTAVNP